VTSHTVSSLSSKPVLPAVEPPKKRRNRDWTGATLALLIGVVGLCLGRLGHLWIRFDVFSQFSIQFLLLAVAAVLGMVSPRLKGLVGSVLFVLFVCLYGLWPHFPQRGAEAAVADGEKRLRVGHFNVHGIHAENEAVIATIRKLNPDVMDLVEFTGQNTPVLEALKSQYPYQLSCLNVSACDFAMISKTPLLNYASKGSWEGSPYIKATLGPEFGNLTVIGTHTTRFPFAVAQFKQVNALAKELQGIPGPMVVMGDFNATPFSRVIQTFAGSLDLIRQSSLPTWPTRFGFPQLAIDHIFTTQAIRALDQERIGDAAGSDHYPVSITLAVPTK
jgi:endonuclease/exonuclease/phosphatase (EEP) superfamily protein YafD